MTSAVGSFVALQKVLEPATEHVVHVKEEKRRRGDREAPGQGDPPGVEDDGNEKLLTGCSG